MRFFKWLKFTFDGYWKKSNKIEINYDLITNSCDVIATVKEEMKLKRYFYDKKTYSQYYNIRKQILKDKKIKEFLIKREREILDIFSKEHKIDETFALNTGDYIVKCESCIEPILEEVSFEEYLEEIEGVKNV